MTYPPADSNRWVSAHRFNAPRRTVTSIVSRGCEIRSVAPSAVDLGIETHERFHDTVTVEELQRVGSCQQGDVLERDPPDRALQHACDMAERD